MPMGGCEHQHAFKMQEVCEVSSHLCTSALHPYYMQTHLLALSAQATLYSTGTDALILRSSIAKVYFFYIQLTPFVSVLCLWQIRSTGFAEELRPGIVDKLLLQ